MSRVVKFIETESRIVVVRDLGERGNELFNGYRVSVSQDEKVLDAGCTTVQIYLILIVHFKMVNVVNFMLVFYRNFFFFNRDNGIVSHEHRNQLGEAPIKEI